MALEGNLTDFALSDVFLMLQKGAKTGALHIESERARGLVCFRDGAVSFASADGSRTPAGKRLAGAAVISEKQLRQAQGLMKIQKQADRRIGQILLDEGYLEASVLENFLRDEVSEALFDLMRWEEGSLRFEPDETCPEADLGITVSVDSVLLDAGRRLELWHKIREKIPSDETRFAMSANPGAKPIDIHLKPKEWLLLCYLHGGKSVAELVELTGSTDFETAKTLYGMYAQGLVEKVGPAGEPLGE